METGAGSAAASSCLRSCDCIGREGGTDVSLLFYNQRQSREQTLAIFLIFTPNESTDMYLVVQLIALLPVVLSLWASASS